MSPRRDEIVLFIAQGAYSGRVPFAPGTAGTIVGVLPVLLLRDAVYCWYALATALVAGIGVWAAGEADAILGTKDSPTIVIDEIAGFLVAMFLVPFSWRTAAAGFVLFRFFDILKPWPLKRLQDIPGGPGVMLDDLGAGVYTNVALQALLLVYGS
jgi:phosphatidylglycerophosphatase A